MDKESIIKYGLSSYTQIDEEASDESYDSSTNNHTIFIRLKKDNNAFCPNCGIVGHYTIRSSKQMKIKHSSGLENNITIILIRRIFKCSDCGYLFKEVNPFKVKKTRFSKEKELQILEQLRNQNYTFKNVADIFNVSTTKVLKIFDEHVNIERGKFSKILSMDEVYTKHCSYHKFCNVSYDPLNNKVLDVLPSRKLKDLIDYYAQIPFKERSIVQYVSIDLYEPYRQLAHKCFPKALVCADHFHVIKNLQMFFNKARIRVMKKYEHLRDSLPEYYWLYKKYWKLLNKNPEKLSHKKFKVGHSVMELSENEIVEYMLDIDKDLNEAYELIVDYKCFNGTATPENVKERLDSLLIRFQNTKCPEMFQGYKLLKNWYNEIINSYQLCDGKHISNGNIERANKVIKDVIRLGYGFHNFNRFRNRILYILNTDASIKY